MTDTPEPKPSRLGELTLDEDDFDGPLTDEEIALGFYNHGDLVERGIVKDRNDQKRKQEKYRFPKPTKTGDRQAPISKARVHRWLRYRDALTRRSQN
jgi:hypothetical protein